MLGRNLPRNFPAIDRFVNGAATSIKSIDLNAATYESIGSLTSKVQSYIDSVARFQGYGPVTPQMIVSRELQLAIPAGAGSGAQWAALQGLQQYAGQANVALTITQIP